MNLDQDPILDNGSTYGSNSNSEPVLLDPDLIPVGQPRPGSGFGFKVEDQSLSPKLILTSFHFFFNFLIFFLK